MTLKLKESKGWIFAFSSIPHYDMIIAQIQLPKNGCKETQRLFRLFLLRHEELLALNGIYWSMWNQQSKANIEGGKPPETRED